MKMVYPVIFTFLHDEKDTVLAEIPDLKNKTQGCGLAEAIEKARDFIGMVGISFEAMEKEMPKPWSAKDFSDRHFPTGNSVDDVFISMVDVDLEKIEKVWDQEAYEYEKEKHWYVKESAFAYNVERKRSQGEYTLEDYYNLPDDRRVELIDGVIYDMGAPTFVHQTIAEQIYFDVRRYVEEKGGKCLPIMSPVDVCLYCDDKTMVQPDMIIVCDKDKIKRWGIMGAPDFVLEVLSDSTRSKDCTKKLDKYTEAGVKEYWIIDPKKKQLIVYDFINGEFPLKYNLDQKVGVALYNGELEIDLKEIAVLIQDWPE